MHSQDPENTGAPTSCCATHFVEGLHTPAAKPHPAARFSMNLFPPFLMVIDDTTNAMVEHNQFCIDMNSRFVLRQFDFLLALLNRRKVFIRI